MEENTIYVHPVNATSVYVSAQPRILSEIYNYFSFFYPGYRFTPSYKNGTWDGKIYLFSINTSTLPHGLVNRLAKFASDNDYKFIDKRVPVEPENDLEAKIEAFMDSLDVRSYGNPIEYYDHQKMLSLRLSKTQQQPFFHLPVLVKVL
jgi:hypothetical protein